MGGAAFDKLLHDLIRIGIQDIFYGNRLATKKYLNETIPISVMTLIYEKDLIAAAQDFDAAIYGKLKIISFQNPTKIIDGLSFIWEEQQKWKKLAEKLGVSDAEIKTRLGLISSRRNSIVHESDREPISFNKQQIINDDVSETINFLEKLGNAICEHVILC